MRFRWVTYDVADLLPRDWRAQVLAAAAIADFRAFPRTPILTREAPDVEHIPRGRVHAHQLRDRLPWLHALYHGAFLELADGACPEPVVTARDPRYGIVLNVQQGTQMRFECHVDSNPLTGVLVLTDHQRGGELVIARDASARDRESIESDCIVIRPQAGHLLLFDARQRPHYVRPLQRESDTRVIAAMNFYTASSPESERPPELNRHLYGDPVRGSC